MTSPRRLRVLLVDDHAVLREGLRALLETGDEGIEIARRTVAKYREMMRIPSSVQRRRKKSTMTTLPSRWQREMSAE